MTFEQTLAQKMAEIKSRLANADIGSMSIQIDVNGRTAGGDAKITFRVGEYGDRAEGFNLGACVDEYLRRKGWTERNEPLSIEYHIPVPEPVSLKAVAGTDIPQPDALGETFEDDKIPF